MSLAVCLSPAHTRAQSVNFLHATKPTGAETAAVGEGTGRPTLLMLTVAMSQESPVRGMPTFTGMPTVTEEEEELPGDGAPDSAAACFGLLGLAGLF